MRLRLGGAAWLAAALLLTPLPLISTAQASPSAPPVRSGHHLLPHGAKGRAAITALGAHLPEAASRNRMKAAKFRGILAHDNTANVDRNGRLFYVDPAPTHAAADSITSAKASTGTPTVAQDVVAVPAYSSRPSSTHTIYLDFDGVTLAANNAWATDPNSPVPAGTYGGFSLDGLNNPGFNADELAFIQKVWRIVSEKYAPYDVNVTTVDPGLAGYSRSSSGDVNYGDHVVFTNDPAPVNDICGGSCAGVAYLSTFSEVGNSIYEPAWVFTSQTYGSAQMSAHDASHEIGHTFGLNHDGDAGHPDYSVGHANWVPIMGITNQNAVAQFSKGEYAGATNTEDDLAIIGQNGNSGAVGSLYAPDDYATTGSTPTALGDQTSYALDGVIGSAADDDIFSIARTCTSALTATATGIGSGQTLDMKVDILDSSNNVLATNDPASGQTSQSGDIGYLATGMDASATLASTTAGTSYRVRVDGVGTGTATTGYTTYGSIGGYHLTITGCPAASLPSAPATTTATPNSRTTTGTVNWTAPASDGGNPITGYKVSGLPGGPVTLGNVLTYNATSLVPGTTYSVSVQAINSSGAGPAGSTTLKVDTWAPTTKPGLVASVVGSTATLTWTAPANPGGATLTGWRVQETTGSLDEVLSPATLTKNYPGLTVGTHTYTVTGQYTATDTAGILASDPQSISATSTPGAPATAGATPTSRTKTGTVTWTAPSFDGGSAVTGYKITGLPGGTVTLGNVLTYGATNLVPGTTYNLAVAATNTNGTGIGAATSLRVDTWAPLAKPGLTATVSGTTATLTWTAPANPGGATLTGWHIQGSGPGNLTDEVIAAGTLTKDYTGLAPGTQSFTVTGQYLADDIAGIQTSDPKSVSVVTAPAAPATATSTPDSRAITGTINWTAPPSDGNSPITGYTLNGLPGGPVSVASNVFTYPATNLVPGTTYAVAIAAVNTIGTGPTRVTLIKVATWAPTTKPVLTVGKVGTRANLSWTVPADPGGATLTGWHLQGTGPGNTIDEVVAAGLTSTHYDAMANGLQTFTVTGQYTADDTAGIVASDPQSVTITGAASAPTPVTATPIPRTGTATIGWSTPASDGGDPITGYKITVVETAATFLVTAAAGSPSVIDGLAPGTSYTINVQALNGNGYGPAASAPLRIDTWAPTTRPALTVTSVGTTATLHWTAPADPGNATLDGWTVHRSGPGGPADYLVAAGSLTKAVTGLALGTQTFTVIGRYTADDTTGVVASDPKTAAIAVVPTAPKIGNAGTGAAGRPITATARWSAPNSTGGATITGYRVLAYKLNGAGRIVRTITSRLLAASVRSFSFRLPAGRYKFRVVAVNRVGTSPYSLYSGPATAR